MTTTTTTFSLTFTATLPDGASAADVRDAFLLWLDYRRAEGSLTAYVSAANYEQVEAEVVSVE